MYVRGSKNNSYPLHDAGRQDVAVIEGFRMLRLMICTAELTNTHGVGVFSIPMDGLTGFQRDLLYVIAGADKPSGQEVKGEIEGYYASEINHGRLYPNLDTLVNKELVEKGELDRRTNYYAITELGEDTIVERREWERQYITID